MNTSVASDFRELLRVIRPDLAIMIHAYFDESGTDRKSVVTCVAGYIFETEQLVRFDEEWQEALSTFGIRRFHMVELAHGSGELKGKSKEDRIELGKRVIGIIKRRARIGLVVSVEEAEYRKVVPQDLADKGGAYMACLTWCICGVAAWVNKHNYAGRISFFFEAGHPLQSVANAAMINLSQRPTLSDGARYHSHSFIGKGDALAIQAADLLAWQWQADWKNQFCEPKRGRRGDFDSLMGLPHMACHLSASNLRAIAAVGSGAPLPEQYRRFGFV